MNFVAIDVETANADFASICQIGIAKYAKGQLVDEWVSLVDPEDYFDFTNVSIHGITDEDVGGCPTFPNVVDELSRFLNNSICVCHTQFDRVSIERATSKYGLDNFNSVWLDSARVARRTWENVAQKGYGLANLAEMLGIDFKHHDALEDAKATGLVMMAAIEKTGISAKDWITKFEDEKKAGSWGVTVSREGNPEGAMFGAVMVFTGLGKQKPIAADNAAKIGCKVHPRVTKKTTHLVVADEVSFFTTRAGRKISGKHEQALENIKKGQSIEILSITEFLELCNRLS